MHAQSHNVGLNITHRSLADITCVHSGSGLHKGLHTGVES